jgi:predicted nucleotidyltransferase
MTTEFARFLQLLAEGEVEFIVIGGVAAIAHGAARLTLDLDIVYRRTGDNLDRIVRTLAPYSPYPRGAPPGLPFVWDARTLRNGLNFTLKTTLGNIDILGEIAGGGTYEDLVDYCVSASVFGIQCLCLDLEHLIRVKRAAGRPKDFEAIAELEAILEERGDTQL